MKKRILIFILLLLMILPICVADDYLLYRSDDLEIEVNSQKYFLDVRSITNEYAELKISNVVFKLSEYYPVRKIDVNDDEYYDLMFGLKELDNKIVLNIQEIHQQNTGWIAFEDVPTIVSVGEKEVVEEEIDEIQKEVEDEEEIGDLPSEFEELIRGEIDKETVEDEINPLTNLTNFSKTYFDKVKTAVAQVPYVGYMVAGLVILSIIILLIEFVFSKKKKVKKKKKKKNSFDKVIDFLLEEED